MLLLYHETTDDTATTRTLCRHRAMGLFNYICVCVYFGGTCDRFMLREMTHHVARARQKLCVPEIWATRVMMRSIINDARGK